MAAGVLCVLLLCAPAGVRADDPTETPTPTPTPTLTPTVTHTPYVPPPPVIVGPTALGPTNTPHFMLGNSAIHLPTLSIYRTRIPITRTPGYNPLGLNASGEDVLAETLNMHIAIRDVMRSNAVGTFLDFIMTLAMAFGTALAILRVFRRTQSVMAQVRGEVKLDQDTYEMLQRAVDRPWRRRRR